LQWKNKINKQTVNTVNAQEFWSKNNPWRNPIAWGKPVKRVYFIELRMEISKITTSCNNNNLRLSYAFKSMPQHPEI